MHLKHLHAYSTTGAGKENASNGGNKYRLKWHTDGGIFLSLLPTRVCDWDNAGDFQSPDDGSFLLEPLQRFGHSDDIGGANVVFPRNLSDGHMNEFIVAIMLGLGTERWLHTPLPLHTARGATDQWGQICTSLVQEDILPIKQRSGGGRAEVYRVEAAVYFIVVR